MIVLLRKGFPELRYIQEILLFDLGIHGDWRFTVVLKIFIGDKGIKIPASEFHPGYGTPDPPARPVQGHG